MIHRCMLNATKTIHDLQYATLYACINDIKEWLSSNFLLFNDKKTELIEYNSNGLNQNNHLVIGNTVIDTQTCVTNLGCLLDLVMSGHAARMCKSAYHHLRCIRKIRKLLYLWKHANS